MKSKKLMDALGETDESYYLPVLPDPLPGKTHRWPLLAATAAVAALCLFGALNLRPLAPDPIPEISTMPAEPVEKPMEQPAGLPLEQELHRLYEEASLLQSLTEAQ